MSPRPPPSLLGLFVSIWGIVMRLLLRYLVVPLCVLVSLLSASAFPEDHKNISSVAPEIDSGSVPAKATPVSLEPKFIGLYGPDGYFKSPDKIPHSISDSTGIPRVHGRPACVPPWVDLQPSEKVIQNLAPPARPRKAMKGRSAFANLRDSFIRAAYGHENVLFTPTQVATDSQHRLIISDPSEPAVHVLDGNASFRIEAGPGHRLVRPHAIAIDNHDNIYIADEKLDLILVYDSEGRFLRDIGDFRGERVFQNLTSIAIDRESQRLYVLDTPLNEIVVLDLNGKIVKRIGGIHHRNTNARFDSPTAIAVENGTMAILDTLASRIQVLDFDGNLRSEFTIRPVHLPPLATDVGIALDTAGNIYASHIESSTVRIYKQTGELIGTLGNPAGPNARLLAPTGVWIDSADNVFVADPAHSMVEVFQVSTDQNSMVSQR